MRKVAARNALAPFFGWRVVYVTTTALPFVLFLVIPRPTSASAPTAKNDLPIAEGPTKLLAILIATGKPSSTDLSTVYGVGYSTSETPLLVQIDRRCAA